MPLDPNGTYRYWMLTIPQHSFTPYLPPGVVWIRGQLERGSGVTEYLHWQVVVCLSRQQRRSWLSKCFGDGCHKLPSESAAANAYVHKEDTYVDGTRFELGTKPINRNSQTDWDSVLASARGGQFDAIPSDILVRYYGSLTRIAADNLRPVGLERTCYVYWGATGLGKSRRAWDEAGLDSYPKDPNTKWWNGYKGHRHVIIDEFRGAIHISHVLRWLDRYPVIVETKGSAVVLKAEKIWITSNLDPRMWYNDIDEETKNALIRRLNITHFTSF